MESVGAAKLRICPTTQVFNFADLTGSTREQCQPSAVSSFGSFEAFHKMRVWNGTIDQQQQARAQENAGAHNAARTPGAAQRTEPPVVSPDHFGTGQIALKGSVIPPVPRAARELGK